MLDPKHSDASAPPELWDSGVRKEDRSPGESRGKEFMANANQKNILLSYIIYPNLDIYV